MNKQLPKAVDAETELTNIAGLDGVFVYNYRLVNRLVSEVDPAALVSAIKPNATTNACTSPETRTKFLNERITMRYKYADKNGTPIASFDVSQSDCP